MLPPCGETNYSVQWYFRSSFNISHFPPPFRVKDSAAVHRTFNVEPLYLQHENSGVAVDFMHWQIPLSRRFRSLKIWFVLRSYGITGLQRHIREGVRLAQKFEALVAADHRFEIPAKRHLGTALRMFSLCCPEFTNVLSVSSSPGLVVFRIKGDNEITERLLKRLNHRGNIHCIPSSLKGKYVIRFTVTSTRTTVDDILRDWTEIKNAATEILSEMNITISNRVYLKGTITCCRLCTDSYASHLILSFRHQRQVGRIRQQPLALEFPTVPQNCQWFLRRNI